MKRIVKTFCGICEMSCGMQVTVEDDEVKKVEGLKEHLHSRGNLCVKGKAAREILYAHDRLKCPMKKESGKWKQISWGEALDIMAYKLNELKKSYGANSLAVYHGQTFLQNSLAMFFMKRFLNLFGTVNLCSAASMCNISLTLSQVATFGGPVFADVENSSCIIIWGANP